MRPIFFVVQFSYKLLVYPYFDGFSLLWKKIAASVFSSHHVVTSGNYDLISWCACQLTPAARKQNNEINPLVKNVRKLISLLF